MRIHIAAYLLLLVTFGCTSGLGAPCEETKDCDHIELGYCALTGTCVATCATEGETCSGDGLCIDVKGRVVCLPQCRSNDDCRPSETCTATVGGEACVLTDPLADP